MVTASIFSAYYAPAPLGAGTARVRVGIRHDSFRASHALPEILKLYAVKRQVMNERPDAQATKELG
ncbi:hypothetical protein [Parapedobacter koreensis]|uniref:hypothetical protein n=1 Tax=Parapedobacter koreensis TaxID=332977 RepID=UPI00115FA760|nr:hypothetical protein [Parapedobacter koreensis]